jgi:NAD(P)-dependent dehydrogenase (short-subunit alcohol dehydrogenase family)
MAGRLEGKVAIVTGAGSGNGRAIAIAFAEEGARVTCADYNGEGARTTADEIGKAGGQARAVAMDVTSQADCERTVRETVEAFGGLDSLVNNAGIWVPGTVQTLTLEEWERQQAVNQRGVFLMTKAAIDALIARGGGSIVMLASQAGLKGSPGSLAYVASKHAVIGMTRCLAIDHAADGIRVNAICPGLIETPMGEQVLRRRGERDGVDQARQRATASHLLGRLGRPEDVAAIAVHFASDEAEWVTGMCYSLDGGSGLAAQQI